MNAMRLQELVGWSLAAGPGDEPAVIVLTVDPSGDPDLAAALAGPAGRGFAGSWRAGTRDDTPIVSFLLLEDADHGLERAWWTDDLDRSLLAAATHVPHHVRLRSATGSRALDVEVDHASARVAEMLARRTAAS